jgi:hypothetical protein
MNMLLCYFAFSHTKDKIYRPENEDLVKFSGPSAALLVRIFKVHFQ